MMNRDPPKNSVGFDVHERAKKMREDGFVGQGMNSPDIAADLIVVAASNPDVEAEMEPRTFAIWWVLNLKYQAYQARQKLGDAPPEEAM